MCISCALLEFQMSLLQLLAEEKPDALQLCKLAQVRDHLSHHRGEQAGHPALTRAALSSISDLLLSI